MTQAAPRLAPPFRMDVSKTRLPLGFPQHGLFLLLEKSILQRLKMSQSAAIIDSALLNCNPESKNMPEFCITVLIIRQTDVPKDLAGIETNAMSKIAGVARLLLSQDIQ